MRMKGISTVGILILTVFLSLSVPAHAAPGTPLLTYGYVDYPNGTPANGALVTIYEDGDASSSITVVVGSSYGADGWWKCDASNIPGIDTTQDNIDLIVTITDATNSNISGFTILTVNTSSYMSGHRVAAISISNKPVINSVTLDRTEVTEGDSILVTVNATDDAEGLNVTAEGVDLIQDGDLWNRTITAVKGTHIVNVSVRDSSGNVVEDGSESYTAAAKPTGDSGGGGDGTYPPGWFETPTPAPTTAMAETPATEEPTETSSVITSEETPTIAASPAETPTTKLAAKGVPGFTAVFAIAGLLAIAYLVLRRRE